MHETQPPKTFGKLRNFLWPIHGYEHRKLLPMLAIFFLITFIYNVLRCMKVTVVVTAEGSGVEVIPFLKFWAVLPSALLITYLYTKLSNRLSREQVFYWMVGLFLGFFTLFLLVLYPNRAALELVTLSDFLQIHLPEGLKGLISVIRHWPLSLFYVLSDMWSATVLSMLFWGFANEVTSVDEAKRFYAIFALSANFSGIISGQSTQMLRVHEYNPLIPFGNDAWEQSLGLQLGVVLLVGAIIIVLFRWVNKSVIAKYTGINRSLLSSHQAMNSTTNSMMNGTDVGSTLSLTTSEAVKEASRKENGADKDSEDKKLSLMECFSYLIKSPYMIYIAIIVVSYNIVYNLGDVLWTYQVKQRFPDPNDFNSYMNRIALITGIFATLSGLILSGNVIRKYGWLVTALITPVIWLITSIGFFGCMLFEGNPMVSDTLYAFFSVPVASLVLFFGSSQICLGRAAKYTVFDETKEIAFIPLPKSEQRKGKTVVDGITSRLGKSGSSFTIQILLVLCGELAATIPFIAGIFLVFLSLWLLAVRRLGKLVAKSIDGPLLEKKLQEEPEGSPAQQLSA